MKSIKGFKMVAFNVVMAVIAIVTLRNPGAEVPDAATVTAGIDAAESALIAVWGIGNVLLRAVTSTPIFKSEA